MALECRVPRGFPVKRPGHAECFGAINTYLNLTRGQLFWTRSCITGQITGHHRVDNIDAETNTFTTQGRSTFKLCEDGKWRRLVRGSSGVMEPDRSAVAQLPRVVHPLAPLKFVPCASETVLVQVDRGAMPESQEIGEDADWTVVPDSTEQSSAEDNLAQYLLQPKQV